MCYKAGVETVDVAIVGGGFAGLATAWSLGRRGVHAIVLEREAELGVYASGRSAGLGRQLVEDDATSALTVRGAALLRAHFAAAWDPTGGILSFDDAAHLAAYEARAARFDVATTRLDRAAILARWPQLAGLAIAGALHVPSDGVIAVLPLVHAFAAAARVSLATAVHAIEPGRVTTSQGTIAARVVVDASGAWAGALVDEPPLDAWKRHVYVIAGAPVTGPYLWHLGRDEVYLRAADGGFLTSPCDEVRSAAGDQRPDAAGEARLRALLGELTPLRSWACQRSFTPDRQMRLGRDPRRPWLVWAAGLGGHGATASPAVGEVVADAAIAALSS